MYSLGSKATGPVLFFLPPLPRLKTSAVNTTAMMPVAATSATWFYDQTQHMTANMMMMHI